MLQSALLVGLLLKMRVRFALPDEASAGGLAGDVGARPGADRAVFGSTSLADTTNRQTRSSTAHLNSDL